MAPWPRWCLESSESAQSDADHWITSVLSGDSSRRSSWQAISVHFAVSVRLSGLQCCQGCLSPRVTGGTCWGVQLRELEVQNTARLATEQSMFEEEYVCIQSVRVDGSLEPQKSRTVLGLTVMMQLSYNRRRRLCSEEATAAASRWARASEDLAPNHDSFRSILASKSPSMPRAFVYYLPGVFLHTL